MADIPWEVFFGIGIVLLGCAIAWGMSMRNSRARGEVSEEAARLLREHGGERYEREDKPRLEREAARRE